MYAKLYIEKKVTRTAGCQSNRLSSIAKRSRAQSLVSNEQVAAHTLRLAALTRTALPTRLDGGNAVGAGWRQRGATPSFVAATRRMEFLRREPFIVSDQWNKL